MTHTEIAAGLLKALNELQTSTLGKIADGFNIPGNWYRQGTWDACIFNQISGGTSFETCANTLAEDTDKVKQVIRFWDSLKGRNPNRTLREFVVKILSDRGIMTDRVVHVESKKLFNSTMVPNFDALEEIPLVSDAEVDTFLQGLLTSV